ncbi:MULTISPECIES: hypothetical protein [Streptomyces]|uniref:FXSXX-COOH protein n=1 Tax=Streptomyces viridochromogenes TaxID=1938 RepID=A0A0L8KIE3_STRVR|nr:MULTISPECIES: hypothetical protein [Streptomyces]KOG25650.1 hypothetical protein ADK34_17480 [Streptomyces viridochromogenes]
MHTSDEHMGSELVDLSDVPLTVVREQDPGLHARSLERLLRQVERPRLNFSTGSGDGPPGRAD